MIIFSCNLITDYPKLSLTYLHTIKDGAAYTRTDNPIFTEHSTIRARTDNKLLHFTPCLQVLTPVA